MKQVVRNILAAVLLIIGGLWAVTAVDAARPAQNEPPAQDEQPVYIYFFWGDGCPHCAQAKPFLEGLTARYPRVQVEAFEVYYSAENQALFGDMAAAHGFAPQYVPTIFVGERNWQGFADPMRGEIESVVRACVEEGCPDAGSGVVPGHEAQVIPLPTGEICSAETEDCAIPGEETPAAPANESEPAAVVPTPEEDTGTLTPTLPEEAETPPATTNSITIPVLGTVDLGAHSLWISTALISFADGFNPCSLWVLSILIAMTLRSGSRRRIFTIGLIYITVTAGVYVLFIAGLFTFLSVVSFLGWIQAAVSVLALFFAAVNIKDYFWYKEGLSFTIADDKKPGIYKRIRSVMNAGDSFWALAGATVALAIGVSLVEFSCTAGFPVVWTNLVAAQGVTPVTFVLLLLLYMLIYQIDELAIYGVAVVTLKASRLEEKHGRMLKLVGGMLMLMLAAVMLIDPTLMNDLGTSLLIFGGAIAAALLVLVIHRRLLPKFGINIGTELSQ